MVDAQTLTTMFGEIGIGVAAFYYVMMLRNMTYTETLYEIEFKTFEEFREKYARKVEWMSKVWFMINHYNSLGLLVKEDLTTSEQIFQQYLLIGIIMIYEKYRPEMINASYRHDPKLEIHNPNAYGGFEFLYNKANRLYPGTPRGPWTKEDLVRHAREIDDLLRAERSV
jgi:hypothetical protein